MRVTIMPRTTLTVTGLRSHKLFGGDYNDPRYIKIVNHSTEFLLLSPWIKVINIGMATGIDLLVGLAALRARKLRGDLLIHCYIPGKDQTKYYNDKEKEIYQFILTHADRVFHTSDEECTAEVLKQRNIEMLKNSNWLLAFWDYHKYKSGTWSTINNAVKKDKTIYIMNPFNLGQREFYHVSQIDETMGYHKEAERVYYPKISKQELVYKGYTDEL